MLTGIIGAMSVETDAIKALITEKKTEKFSGVEVGIEAFDLIQKRVRRTDHMLEASDVIAVGMREYPCRNLSVADVRFDVARLGIRAAVYDDCSVLRSYDHKSHCKWAKFRKDVQFCLSLYHVVSLPFFV